MSPSVESGEMFVYTGIRDEVPQDVVRVTVDPSVTSIPVHAFIFRQKLAEVELCEGLVEGSVPSLVALQFRRLISPTHSEGFVILPSLALSDVQFVSTWH